MRVVYKVETWIDAKLDDELTKEQVIDLLKGGVEPYEVLCENLYDFENLVDTETYLSPKENDNQATVELYEGDQLVWSNVE